MTPYGYKIVKGKAMIDLEAARQVRDLFRLYLSGRSIKEAKEESGFPLSKGTAGHILERKVYVGTDFYPSIITKEMYDRVQEERERRRELYGKVKFNMPQEANPVKRKFQIRFPRVPSNAFCPDDASLKAQLIYSLIQASDTGGEKITPSEKEQVEGFLHSLPKEKRCNS